MADLQKTIQIIFGATDNVSDTTSDIDHSIGGLANSVEASTQPFADLASNILKVETAITAMGVAVLFYANNAAVELAGSETDLQKVLAESEGSVDQYTDVIKELSLVFGVAGADTTSSAADFRQAGFTIEESLKLVESSLTAVKIAELSSTEAGDLLISNIRGIGAEAEDATHFMDAWNEISNTYAVTAREVAIATGALSPIAKTAGLSFDELVGLVTPMIEVLRSGSETATTLKTSLASLISPTAKVVESLEALGISQHDANGELRLSGEILNDLGDLWPTLTDSQQANYGILLFGKEQYARMNIVLNDYNKVLEVTEASQNSTGSALAELTIKLGTAKVASEKLSTAFGYAASTVGKQYLDQTIGITSSLTGLTIAFDDIVASGGLAPLFDFLNPLLDEFSANIDKIATNLPAAFEGVDFTGLINSFKEIGFEFGELFGPGDITTIEGLENAIQFVVDGLTALNTIFSGVIEGFAPVIEVFKELAEQAGDADDSTAKFIGNVIGYGATINVFSGWISGLTQVFSSLTDGIIVLASAKALGILPASFEATAISASSLSKVLGKAGLAGSVLALGYEFGLFLDQNTDIRSSFQSIFETIDGLVGGPLSDFEQQLSKNEATAKLITDANNKQADSVDNINDAHVKAFEEATKYDGAVKDVAESTELAIKVNSEMELSQARLALQMINLGLNIDGTKFSIEESGRITKITSGEFEGWYRVLEDGAEVFYKTKAGAEAVTDSLDKVAESEKKAKEEAEKAAKASEDLKIKYAELEVELEKIASNERIKTMEFAVELETAKIEADAKKVVAAFESISESYAATSDLIGSLYGNLSDLDRSQQIDIERSIRKAEDLAEEQWEVQKRLLEAQIEQMEASTERLDSGDALITVDGGELQPELESIMQSLFKNIRISMSAEYENFLLGLQP